ncbi:predicted protein [Histoplasma capsulatum var. duboisii H88]|uniref:Predicted protein n=1 Tax=Ajellomyces capsulatus (strain H88) TaxID=544711 RepID=F0UCJ3_AJEC8|nr:predicted protein [Histoplasma capsulatum var. duboisii H88]
MNINSGNNKQRDKRVKRRAHRGSQRQVPRKSPDYRSHEGTGGMINMRCVPDTMSQIALALVIINQTFHPGNRISIDNIEEREVRRDGSVTPQQPFAPLPLFIAPVKQGFWGYLGQKSTVTVARESPPAPPTG